MYFRIEKNNNQSIRNGCQPFLKIIVVNLLNDHLRYPKRITHSFPDGITQNSFLHHCSPSKLIFLKFRPVVILHVQQT